MNRKQSRKNDLRSISSRGQTIIEYALIIALIAFVVIAAMYLLGPAIANFFNGLATTVNTSI